MQLLINAILRFRNALIFFGLLILSFVFLNQRSNFHQTQLAEIGLWLSGSVFQSQTAVENYFNLRQENQNLLKENTFLQQQLLQARQQASSPTNRFNFEVIQARIIKGSFNQARNMVILNKGTVNGVLPEMGIIS